MSRIRALLWSGTLLGSLVVPHYAQAQSFEVLHNFQGGSADGQNGGGSLAWDKAGNLYGTTQRGGGRRGAGKGIIFKLAPDGTESTLMRFTGKQGELPYGVTIDKKGSLYGTTTNGGNKNCVFGCGVVFEVKRGGKEKVLHYFLGGDDGYEPEGPPISDSEGNLYGTSAGDAGSGGIVFKLAPDGTKTTLYDFQGGSDGIGPTGPLIMDDAGVLYGTTLRGGVGSCFDGTGCGTVFKLAPDGTKTTLYSFRGGSDGALPMGSLVIDASGSLYGATSGEDQPHGGTIFKIAPNGIETVLYNFCSQQGCADGAGPLSGLTADKKGNLYGTTNWGGTADFRLCQIGCGTVFKLAPNRTYTLLHLFSGYDGSAPGSVMLDKERILYGTTYSGGSGSCYDGGGNRIGCGVIFRIIN